VRSATSLTGKDNSLPVWTVRPEMGRAGIHSVSVGTVIQERGRRYTGD
jgi:hypothetical protein